MELLLANICEAQSYGRVLVSMHGIFWVEFQESPATMLCNKHRICREDILARVLQNGCKVVL